MTSRFIRGRRARGLQPGDDQIVTLTTEMVDGRMHEHITPETPKALTDTQRLRLVKTWETQKEWPT